MLGSEGLRASIFGAVGLAIDGDPIELRGRQRRRMVATLLADVGRPVPALRLLDVLDVRPTSSAATDPANAVQAQVRRLRDLIEPGVPARSASRLRSTAEGYVLQPAAYDLWDYSTAVRAARDLIETAPRSSVEQYCTARAMWFSPWGDLGDDPLVSGIVSHLEEQHRIVEEEWGGLILDLGQGSLYADELLAMARREPSRERRWGAAIRALFQASRQADALRTSDEARSTLRQEFGVDPGADLIEVERAVLRQDHAALGARRSEQTVATSSRSAPLTSFVGRCDELTLLDEATARHRVVTVIGLGGVGKSRLVAEWSTRSPAGTSAHSIDLRGVERGEDIGRRFADDMDLGTAGEDQIDPIDLVVATQHREPTPQHGLGGSMGGGLAVGMPERRQHRRRERPGRLRPRLRVLRAPDFLSSKVFSGEMGTRAGADLACQIMAAEAGFEDEYKYRALLADASGSPNTFVDPDPDGLGRPFILPGGLIIAASYPALIKLGPGDGITTTEQGEMLSTRPATPISRTPPPPAPSGPPPIPSSRRASASTPPCPEIRRRSPSGGPRSTGSASRPTFVISPTACPGDGPGVVMP